MSLQSQQHTTKHDRIPLVFTPVPQNVGRREGRRRGGERNKESSKDEIEIGRGRKGSEKYEVIFTFRQTDRMNKVIRQSRQRTIYDNIRSLPPIPRKREREREGAEKLRERRRDRERVTLI